MAIRHLCMATLAGAAVIHLAVVPEHRREWYLAAAFFVVLAVVEAGLAIAVLRRPTTNTLVFAAIVSVATVGLWLVSRTVGLPIGPEHFAAESVRPADFAATLLETSTVVLALGLVRRQAAPVTSRT